MRVLNKTLLIFALVSAMLAAESVSATIVYPRARTTQPAIVLQSGATTGASETVDLHHELTFTAIYVVWNGTCTAGVVEVQVALTAAGPWRTVATVDHEESPGVDKTDALDWIVLTGSPAFLRTNITTPVTGGTVDTSLAGK